MLIGRIQRVGILGILREALGKGVELPRIHRRSRYHVQSGWINAQAQCRTG